MSEVVKPTRTPSSQSIHATSASPFKKLPWGRATQRPLRNDKTRLYLHVFAWPKDGKLAVPGLGNKVLGAYLLADPPGAEKPLAVGKQNGVVVVTVPAKAPDPVDTVVVLDVEGKPAVKAPN